MIAKTTSLFVFLMEFLRLLQQSVSLTLTIDSHLTLRENDCYSRMLIGSKFREDRVISATTIPVSDLSKCEELCTKRGKTCKVFTFGVGRKGNVSCSLASEVPRAQDLKADSHYDVYVKEEYSARCREKEITKSFSRPRESKGNTANSIPNRFITSTYQQQGLSRNTLRHFFEDSFDTLPNYSIGDYTSKPSFLAAIVAKGTKDKGRGREYFRERSDALLGKREDNYLYRNARYERKSGYSYPSAYYLPTAKLQSVPDSCSTCRTSFDGCSLRLRSGSMLTKTVVRRARTADSFDHCEQLCIAETTFSCASFSYRHAFVPFDPTENCLLSDLTQENLNLYTDLEPQREYDVYSLIRDPTVCQLKKASSVHASEECFSRIRSGFGIALDALKKSMLVNDLGECQMACVKSREFVCRSIAFRHKTVDLKIDRTDTSIEKDDRKKSNCFLTDYPSSEINPKDMPDMDEAEVYERGSASRGCEPYSGSLWFISATRVKPKESPVTDGPLYSDDISCYIDYRQGSKLKEEATSLSCYVPSEAECRRLCTDLRQDDLSPCMSFSFKISSSVSKPTENCFLSNVPSNDLTIGLDYANDDGYTLYSWKYTDPRCARIRNPESERKYESHDRTLNIATQEYPHSKVNFHNYPRSDYDHWSANTYSNRFESLSHPADIAHSQLSAEQEPLEYYYPSELSIFRRYTVTGQPCRNGTECQPNEIAGFWSCELETSDERTWDYCCHPRHQCGFSAGYSYPWCYVGPREDQWRPCSETYQSTHTGIPTYNENTGTYQEASPSWVSYRADYQAQSRNRHWPILYLHTGPPPNCTPF